MSLVGNTASNTLLPAHPELQDHPPIFLKLNEVALELLAASLNDPPNVTLSISDQAAALRINDYEFQGSHYREPGSVQLFLPEDQPSAYRSMGFVQSRVNLKQEKPVKLASPPRDVDMTQPVVSKITGLLAIKPHTASELAAKTQASSGLVQAVLDKSAVPHGSDQYILMPNAKKDVKESKKVPKAATPPKASVPPPKTYATSPNTGAASPNAGTTAPKTGAASPKIGTIPPKTDATSSKIGTASPKLGATSPKTGTASPKTGAESPKAATPPKTATNGNAASVDLKRNAKRDTSLKRKLAQEINDTPKKPKPSTEDMFELARKFKEVYGEYLELYGKLSNPKARPPSQVQRLMAMHRQLGQWKKTLWSNARSKGQVK